MTDFLELPAGDGKLAGNFNVVSLCSVVNLFSLRRNTSMANSGLVQNICLSIHEMSLVRLWPLLLLDYFSDFGGHVRRRYAIPADISKLLCSRLFSAFACEETVDLSLSDFFWLLRLRCFCTPATLRIDAIELFIGCLELLKFLLSRQGWVNHACYDPRLDRLGSREALGDIYRLKVVICVPDVPLLGNTRETVLHFI